MRPRAARLAALATFLLFIALASTAAGATASVNISGFAFVPASLTINVGDTVTWTNKDAAAHSAVVNGVGQTPVLAQNQSGSLTFNAAGTFPYVCGIHGAAMMGTVIVRAVATPVPTVAPTIARTVAPTPQPTAAPTVEPTIPPTPSASPTPTETAIATSAAPTIAVVVPTEKAAAPAASSDSGGPSPLIIAAAAILAIAVIAGVLTRVRR
jgi:plastocyanin